MKDSLGGKPAHTVSIKLSLDNGKIIIANELVKDAIQMIFKYWSIGSNKQTKLRIPQEKLEIFKNLIPGLYECGLFDFIDNGISKVTVYMSEPGEAILRRMMN